MKYLSKIEPKKKIILKMKSEEVKKLSWIIIDV